MPEQAGTTSADLTQYARVIRRHWRLISAAVVIGLGLGLLATKLQAPRYDATAKVAIPQSATQAGRDQNITDVQTEVQVMKSEQVATLAAKTLRDGRTPRQLLSHLQVKAPTEARVLAITYNGKTGDKASAGAQAFAEAYISFKGSQAKARQAAQLKTLRAPATTYARQLADAQKRANAAPTNSAEYRDANAQVTKFSNMLSAQQALRSEAEAQPIDGGSILSPAVQPQKPSGPDLVTNMGIGLLGGLVIGLILTFTRDRFDEQVREVADLEQVLNVPILGSVPIFPDRHRNRQAALVTLHAPEGPHADAFRRLRSSVLLALRSANAQILAVTSANAAEGKSTVSANLAVALAQAGCRTCLVSADVRRPTIEQFFEVEERRGLMEALEGTIPLDEAVIQVGSLAVVTSGTPQANPTDLLQSAAMRRVFADLRQRFEYVVVDTPPVLAVADVLGMVPTTDAVVLVVSASETSEAEVEAAEAQLRQVGANIIGAIMNRSVTSTRRYEAYYRTGAVS